MAEPGVKKDLEQISKQLGLPDLAEASDRLTQVIAESRNDVGHDRLLIRSMVKYFGRFRVLCLVPVVVFGIPWAAVEFKQWCVGLLGSSWLQSLHDAAVGWTAGLLSVAAIVGRARRMASSALKRLDQFNHKLERSVAQQTQDLAHSNEVKRALEAERELQDTKQALDAAEQSLVEANSRLVEARQEFENGTARGRLNAFIRAKATDGSYARHLGIIASIRKDFVQLASLMGASNNTEAEDSERAKLKKESRSRVRAFLEWVKATPNMDLTRSEVESLLKLIDPDDIDEMLGVFEDSLKGRLSEPLSTIRDLAAQVRGTAAGKLPRFSRIILYIDDLDRCPPDKVVDVLQAAHLLLCFPLFVVMVAVDVRWVSHSLHKQYPQLLTDPTNSNSMANTAASSYDYLEKIFQIPYWVRPMDAPAAQSCVRRIASGATAQPLSPPPPATIVSFTTAAQDRGTATSNVPQGPASTHDAEAGNAGSASKEGLTRADAPSSPPIVEIPSLSPQEVEVLSVYAPYVGGTPRQAIRFVNLYRLIKTSLNTELQDALKLDGPVTAAGRALVPQLAIVTGASEAARRYFRLLATADPGLRVEEFAVQLKSDVEFNGASDKVVVAEILETLSAWEGIEQDSSSVLRVQDMRYIADTVRRYSFVT